MRDRNIETKSPLFNDSHEYPAFREINLSKARCIDFIIMQD